jgi:hypothetical protein
VRPHPGFSTPFLVGTPMTMTLTIGYIASSIVSFSVSWVATALLLRHYQEIGSNKILGYCQYPFNLFFNPIPTFIFELFLDI